MDNIKNKQIQQKYTTKQNALTKTPQINNKMDTLTNEYRQQK